MTTLSELPITPEIIIEDTDKHVTFTVKVGPVVNSKTFRKRKRAKGYDWAVAQVLEISESLAKNMPGISV